MLRSTALRAPLRIQTRTERLWETIQQEIEPLTTIHGQLEPTRSCTGEITLKTPRRTAKMGTLSLMYLITRGWESTLVEAGRSLAQWGVSEQRTMQQKTFTTGQVENRLEQSPLNKLTYLFVLATLSASAIADGAVSAVKDEAKIMLSASGSSCWVSLSRNRENGALEMYLDDKKEASDVTSLISLADSVIYATGPVYGSPGIRSLTCGHKPKILVSAKNISKGYPAGTDYFELEKYDQGLVSYLYIRDIDSADLDKLRAAKNKRQWRRTLLLTR